MQAAAAAAVRSLGGGVPASAATSTLSHAGGPCAAGQVAACGSSYGYTIWCTTLVQLVTFGALYLYLLHQYVQQIQLALGLFMIAQPGSCLLGG